MAAEVKKAKKKDRRVPTNGVAHVQASFNNTIVTLTDTDGNVISWSSAGRSTPAIRATVFLLLLPLLVARVPAADHPDDALAPDHLAVLTDLLDRRTNLHLPSPRRERRSLGPTRDQDSATCSGR